MPAERQRRAVAAIEALGGSVLYMHQQATNESSPIAFLRRWLPADYLDEVEQVYLVTNHVTDAGLAHLQGLTSLRELRLRGTQVTNAGVAKLRQALPNCKIRAP